MKVRINSVIGLPGTCTNAKFTRLDLGCMACIGSTSTVIHVYDNFNDAQRANVVHTLYTTEPAMHL